MSTPPPGLASRLWPNFLLQTYTSFCAPHPAITGHVGPCRYFLPFHTLPSAVFLPLACSRACLFVLCACLLVCSLPCAVPCGGCCCFFLFVFPPVFLSRVPSVLARVCLFAFVFVFCPSFACLCVRLCVFACFYPWGMCVCACVCACVSMICMYA